MGFIRSSRGEFSDLDMIVRLLAFEFQICLYSIHGFRSVSLSVFTIFFFVFSLPCFGRIGISFSRARKKEHGGVIGSKFR